MLRILCFCIMLSVSHLFWFRSYAIVKLTVQKQSSFTDVAFLLKSLLHTEITQRSQNGNNTAVSNGKINIYDCNNIINICHWFNAVYIKSNPDLKRELLLVACEERKEEGKKTYSRSPEMQFKTYQPLKKILSPTSYSMLNINTFILSSPPSPLPPSPRRECFWIPNRLRIIITG